MGATTSLRGSQNSNKAKIFCHGTNDTLGHASIVYEVNIQYNKQVKPSDFPRSNIKDLAYMFRYLSP